MLVRRIRPRRDDSTRTVCSAACGHSGEATETDIVGVGGRCCDARPDHTESAYARRRAYGCFAEARTSDHRSYRPNRRGTIPMPRHRHPRRRSSLPDHRSNLRARRTSLPSHRTCLPARRSHTPPSSQALTRYAAVAFRVVGPTYRTMRDAFRLAELAAAHVASAFPTVASSSIRAGKRPRVNGLQVRISRKVTAESREGWSRGSGGNSRDSECSLRDSGSGRRDRGCSRRGW